MGWTIKYTSKAEKVLAKLGKDTALRLIQFMDDRVASADDPRKFGKALSGTLRDFWRYRVGDYRILVKIEDEKLVVLVVQVGHRSRIYEGN